MNDTVTTATRGTLLISDSRSPHALYVICCVCFSYLSTQTSDILNLSHGGIINSVVPPATNGTLKLKLKAFASKS